MSSDIYNWVLPDALHFLVGTKMEAEMQWESGELWIGNGTVWYFNKIWCDGYVTVWILDLYEIQAVNVDKILVALS